jgi:translation initiation factor 2B subunit (eIF-2B alpha/beta/delta family)
MTEKKISQKIREIVNDNESGATEFIEKVLEIYEIHTDLLNDDLKENKRKTILLSRKIINSRPSMATLINTVGIILEDLDKVTSLTLQKSIEKFRKRKAEIQENLTKNFKSSLTSYKKKGLKIMLISYSSTITELLLNIKNISIEIFVLESRPLFEGRKTAQILSKKFTTHLIIDAAMGFFIDDIDVVLVGIDSILKDGSIINKIGTYPLAVIAQKNLCDVYAVGSSLKYNLKNHYGKDITIEKKPDKELINDLDFFNGEIQIHNYYFEKTPKEFITGLISDLGVEKIDNFIEKVINTLPIEEVQDLI